MLKPTVLRTMMVVAVIGLLTLLAVATQASAQGRSDWALEHVIDVQEKYTDLLMAKAGGVGTAVGHNREGQLAVKVFVKTGADAADIPRHLDGVPVSVDVTGEIVALVDRTARFARPVPIGVSTGHPNITAGTIGSRVKDIVGNVYALSNNHVYADENRAFIGDNVLQPGPYDGGTEGPNPLIVDGDEIGTLYDFEPILFCNPYPSNCPNNRSTRPLRCPQHRY